MSKEDPVAFDLERFCGEGWQLGRLEYNGIVRENIRCDPDNLGEHVAGYVYGFIDGSTMVIAERILHTEKLRGISFSSYEYIRDDSDDEMTQVVRRAQKALRESSQTLDGVEPMAGKLIEILEAEGFTEDTECYIPDRGVIGLSETDQYFAREYNGRTDLVIIGRSDVDKNVVEVQTRVIEYNSDAIDWNFIQFNHFVVPDSSDAYVIGEVQRQINFIDEEFPGLTEDAYDAIDLSRYLSEDWTLQVLEEEDEEILMYQHPESTPKNMAFVFAHTWVDGDEIVVSENRVNRDDFSGPVYCHIEVLSQSMRDLETAVKAHAATVQLSGIKEAEMNPKYISLEGYLMEQGFKRDTDIELGDREECHETDNYFTRERGDYLDIVIIGYGDREQGFIEVQTRISYGEDIGDVAKLSQKVFAEHFSGMTICPVIDWQINFMMKEYAHLALTNSFSPQEAAIEQHAGFTWMAQVDE